MDLTLPDYNGYDLASELKKKLPDAILTIVSGHEADSETMTTIGINSALLKPVTKDDLASVVGWKVNYFAANLYRMSEVEQRIIKSKKILQT